MNRHRDDDIQTILQEMRSDYWRHLEADNEQASAATEDFLVVRIADRRYALPAGDCREVLRLPALVRVPRVPAHIRGIFNLRGEIVAVTDLAPLFASPPQEILAGSRLVVTARGGMKTALLVAAVEGLTSLETARIEPLADGAAAGQRELFRGKRNEEGESLLVLNLDKVLERPELLIDQKGQMS
ncbi:MAG: chemotaxis protein CheW [Desulfuromonadales bacterium]|nr:chemotaxis protein CheW [Desulfuromonadales bacterium]